MWQRTYNEEEKKPTEEVINRVNKVFECLDNAWVIEKLTHSSLPLRLYTTVMLLSCGYAQMSLLIAVRKRVTSFIENNYSFFRDFFDLSKHIMINKFIRKYRLRMDTDVGILWLFLINVFIFQIGSFILI